MAENNTSSTQNNTKISNVECYTCFPYGTDTILCNTGTDDVKFVRKYMHPTDPIKWTMWLFEAKIQCAFNNDMNSFKKRILSNFDYTRSNTLEFVNADED
jgi:hypothetical protein